MDCLHGDPVHIEARILQLLDEEIPIFEQDPTSKQRVGRIAVLQERGFVIVVTEYKGGFESVNILGYLGYDVSQMKALVLKGSSGAYKEVFGDIPAGYLYPASLGITNPDVTKIGDFQRLRRPIWPLDEGVRLRYR